MKKRVVIIGAGPAGLTAGYELLNSNSSNEYEVIILEASQEIGGISRTVQFKGNRMDIGGHRFFSKDRRVMDWWQDMMPLQGRPSYDDMRMCNHKELSPSGPDPEREDVTMLKRNRVSRIYYNKKFFDYPISLKMQTLKNMGFLTTMQAGCSYFESCIYKKKETSLENFYENRFGKKLYSMFFEGYTEKLWGRHPRMISADWGAQRVKGLSITAILKDMITKVLSEKNSKYIKNNKDTKNNKPKKSSQVETSLIEEFWYPKYGPGQLWEITAAKVIEMGGSILKGSEVTSVNVAEGKVKSVTYLHDGMQTELSGDIFISSMPMKDLVNAWTGESVPEQVVKVANGLPYRDFVTVGVLVNKLSIKNETDIKTLHNRIPDCWIYVQDTGVKLGRIQIFNNWSPYMVADVEHTVWVGLEYFCNESDEFWNLTDTDCYQMAIRELEKIGVIDRKDVLDFHREKVKKAYPAYFDTYNQLDAVKTFLNAHVNLYCVGRNGQHRYNNMDHSMVTSFEAVHNILTGKTDKTNVWNVNTDAQYHEKK